MSKRVSNSRTARESKLHARQKVRFGWRKRRAHAIIAAFKEQQHLNSLGVQA